MADECQWWYACRRPATTTREAPWGDVPICGPCALRVDEVEANTSPRARQAKAAARRAKEHRERA